MDVITKNKFVFFLFMCVILSVKSVILYHKRKAKTCSALVIQKLNAVTLTVNGKPLQKRKRNTKRCVLSVGLTSESFRLSTSSFSSKNPKPSVFLNLLLSAFSLAPAFTRSTEVVKAKQVDDFLLF